MILRYHKSFQKHFKSLPVKRKQAVKNSIAAFEINPFEDGLRNHALTAKWRGHRSISAGGDLRIHYKEIDKDTILFVAVGTHSQLYK